MFNRVALTYHYDVVMMYWNNEKKRFKNKLSLKLSEINYIVSKNLDKFSS
ncbi:MAG: hypothetical protein RLZZ540_2785 [Bacteroidota bacterium]